MLAMQELGCFQLPGIVYRSLQHGAEHYHAATWSDGREWMAQQWDSGSRHGISFVHNHNIRTFCVHRKVLDLWVQLMKNGGKNKSVAFIILFSVCCQSLKILSRLFYWSSRFQWTELVKAHACSHHSNTPHQKHGMSQSVTNAVESQWAFDYPAVKPVVWSSNIWIRNI